MIDTGTGSPIVVVPGIQGRWEWMHPAIVTLSRRHRVLTYSLSRTKLDGNGNGFDHFIEQLNQILDTAELEQATICGVSYGGLIALRYAARHANRVSSLILVSTPGPSWKPNYQVERYLQLPRLLSPAFVARGPSRLWHEIARAHDTLPACIAFSLKHTFRVVTAPCSPTQMAERIRLLKGINFATDCLKVTAPTLVITGEPRLDRMVPVSSTKEFLHVIPHAVSATLGRTGHIGLLSRPEDFAEIVEPFVAAHDF